jgi:hypothetical protein
MQSFYRTSAGAEIDLVLEMPGKHGLWAIEIKRGLSPSPGKGFIIARADLKPKRKARERGLAQGICLRVGFESHEARAIRRTSSITDAA